MEPVWSLYIFLIRNCNVQETHGIWKRGFLKSKISKLGPRRAAAPLLHNSSQPVPDRASRAETKESSTGLHFPSSLYFLLLGRLYPHQVFTGTANIVQLFCHLTPKTDFSQNEVFTQVRYCRLPSTLATEAATEGGGGVGFLPRREFQSTRIEPESEDSRTVLFSAVTLDFSPLWRKNDRQPP